MMTIEERLLDLERRIAALETPAPVVRSSIQIDASGPNLTRAEFERYVRSATMAAMRNYQERYA
jgi:hypothetical protein